MRYAQGLNLATALRAGEISAAEIDAEVGRVAGLLRGFSPEVEVSTRTPGLFWLNAKGLSRLFPSLTAWARQIHGALARGGRRASVVVGFRRFALCAVARSCEGVQLLATPREEAEALGRVPLACLGLAPQLRDDLDRLGVRTVGAFLRLPRDGVRRRFGGEAARLHALAAGAAHDPLIPTPAEEPVACAVPLEAPDGDGVRLLFLIRRHLHPLLGRLAGQGEALRELEIRFLLERMDPRTDRVRPADPTLEEALILDLVRLRLEAAPLPAPVTEMGLTARGAPARREQLRLFRETPKRDLAAADRALARLRAELGDEAVVRARLTEGHLPEARFAWEPLVHMARPQPRTGGRLAMVRRLHARPISLGMRPRHEPDGWLVRDLRCGPVVRTWGPYVISGGWWRTGERGGAPLHRRYYFLETLRGDLLWVYYDGPRRRWFLQGRVE
jgi:protein ImuB